MRRRRGRPRRAHDLSKVDPATLAKFARWIDRWNELLPAAHRHMRTARFTPGEVDGYFWDVFREGLLKAGALTEEIDRIAASMVCLVTDHLEADDHNEREYHLELIARHLACTDMTVGIRKGAVVWIHFPNRPQVQ